MKSAPSSPPKSATESATEQDGVSSDLRAGLSPTAIRLSAILWPSFMLAGVATMVFFAFIDPHELNLISFPGIEFSRELGYSLGFFLFWLIAAASSYTTALWLNRRK